MSEAPKRGRGRPGAALLLVALPLALGAAWLLPTPGLIALGERGTPASDAFRATVAQLHEPPLVLVDLDADLGTYPEIRYATRAALADLLAVRASLAFVSFSPDGRAIALAELDRLRGLGADPARLLDLGFRSGAEAGLVQLAGSGIGDASGPIADEIRRRGHGLAGFDLVLVVGGAEIGPRSWIEQVAPRIPQLRVAAITPTFLLPEVKPYRDTRQLAALLGTLPDDIAYGRAVAAEDTGGAAAFTERPPSENAIGLGLLVALAVLAVSGAGSLAAWVRGPGRRR